MDGYACKQVIKHDNVFSDKSKLRIIYAEKDTIEKKPCLVLQEQHLEWKKQNIITMEPLDSFCHPQ